MFFKVLKTAKTGALMPPQHVSKELNISKGLLYYYIGQGLLNTHKEEDVRCTFVIFDGKYKALRKKLKEAKVAGDGV